ncbi:DUF423 domain-containing protein [Legionella spiritensis]|uniref:DUF423 domain-containing protein n=1 Tax=Legionella spiritensis TaxID=452 RepID=A0A0W0Z576_LEGSP|nr:DUF423 domain-containing protein [Legionella spiritensis]KTD64297.1 hypothetical protein Lspi_1104 [Legionella spiritensis]SNV46808.1 Protein of uncharacterised function (DUF423) [Legionella spiritensis]VEG91139.1 Protein of uncharacterised function (DUF423) [Legionella spiritensis]
MTASVSETIMSRRFIAIGALSAMIATILGAFAAHALQEKLTKYQIHVFQTGIFYQFIHSLALLFVGMILLHFNKRLIQISGWFFFMGILFFSGSLYLISLLQINTIGIITPIGGACFIIGWSLLAVGVSCSKSKC